MKNTMFFHSKNRGTQFWSQNKEIKETPKMIITVSNHLKKSEFVFYLITDEVLTESQKDKGFNLLESLFENGSYELFNGNTLTYDKKDDLILVDDDEDIISKGNFEDIFRSELGMKCN